MRPLTELLEKWKNRLFYFYLSRFHKDLFEDLNTHSWPRGSQLRNAVKSSARFEKGDYK